MEPIDLNKLTVELIPQVGLQGTDLGPVEIDHGQMFVQANGKRVGIYCGRADQAGKHLSFTQRLPQPLMDAIAKKVAEKTGGVGKATAPPPEEHDIDHE